MMPVSCGADEGAARLGMLTAAARRRRGASRLCAGVVTVLLVLVPPASGDPWSAANLPLPVGVPSARLYGITCPAAAACTAVGDAIAPGDPLHNGEPLTWDESGGSWRVTVLPL